MKWAIAVERVTNGYICRWYDEDEEGKPFVVSEVFEEIDTEKGELYATLAMLYRVKEHFGVHFSKHNKFNLDISIKKNKEFGT
jgi:hypothetical protein